MKKLIAWVTIAFCMLKSVNVFAQIDLNKGLIAYYPFNGNANDASGNGNNANFNNATPALDYYGNPNSAYYFNGADNYIRIPNAPSINPANTISVCAWVKPMGFYKGKCHGNSILMKGDGDYLTGSYLLRFDDNFITKGNNCVNALVDTVKQTYYGLANTYNQADTPYVEKNVWQSLVYTYDGSTSRLYVGCLLVSEVNDPGRTFSNSYDLFLGRLNSIQYPYWFNGVLDEVRIYNRALNVDEIKAYSFSCKDELPCNNWLNVTQNVSGIQIGDLDISGKKITVEATFNRTKPYTGNELYAGNLVSKHAYPTDVNYLLRPNTAEITTTNGYFRTPDICDIELNKTYHVAMVYDGSTLKFYRDGYLMSLVPCTGDLYQNNYITAIGTYAADPINYHTTNFEGYINEVRIWNVVRTQAQLREYMNGSLPNPATQTGLLAYYTFDDLKNKQGNSFWDGSLIGDATINNINPQCTFISDSCSSSNLPVIGNIINAYTPVLALDKCENTLTVTDASAFKAGDTVLIIQMKGAVVDNSNSSSFGNIINYNSAGNYEFNYVKSINSNNIILQNTLERSYEIPNGKVQLVRVPYYSGVAVSSTLSCPAWDGSKGGVIVLNAKDSVVLNSPVDVSGKGFRGGTGVNTGLLVTNCFTNGYNYSKGNIIAAQKGESITSIDDNILCGKGAPAAGGGGGLDHNSGGGGGGNGGPGGFGGYQLNVCGSSPYDNRGIGGRALSYSGTSNKIFMGSGGGAGHANNPGNTPPDGGNGGGIIIITTPKLINNTQQIISNGGDATQCTNASDCHDGMGGGGAAGTILLNVQQFVNNLVVNTNGGKGADIVTSNVLSAGLIGPGGGGGGGILWVSSPSLSSGINYSSLGGARGVIINDSNNPWGSVNGSSGQTLFNLTLPFDNTSFKKNIDSIRFAKTLSGCNSFLFSGIAYTNSSPVVNWQWSFGDGGTASSQNISHTYSSPGTYTVKLIGTDINGCKDSISQQVIISIVNANATGDTTICSGSSAQLNVTVIGTASYLWSPSNGLSSTTIANPIANPTDTTKYFVTVTDESGCKVIDSVTVNVAPLPVISTINDTTICPGTSVTLTTTGNNSNTYSWSPGTGLNNAGIKNPVASPKTQTKYIVTATTTSGCKSKDSVTVSLYPAATITTSNDTTICHDTNVQLSASGGVNYSWSPAGSLNNPDIANPVANPDATTNYIVTVTDGNSCAYKDSVKVSVIEKAQFSISPDQSVCPGQSVTISATGGGTYQWSPDTVFANPSLATQTVAPGVTTTYTVTINANNFCNDQSVKSTTVSIKPDAVIGTRKDNDIDCIHTGTRLYAAGAATYEWSPTSGLDDATKSNPMCSIDATTTYIVKGTTSAGCTGYDTITVYVTNDGGDIFQMPSAFTPNGDGLNDCFGISKWGDITNLQFEIFNKWGNLIFRTTNPSECWDGNYKDMAQPPGVYVYWIRATSKFCGNIFKKGTVVIIR